jgi:hypothetical protein
VKEEGEEHMINAGEAFANAVSQTSRHFRLRIYDGSNEVAGSVRSAVIHLGSTGPDTFAIGAVYSSYAEIVLDGRETTLEGKELRLDVGILTDPANDTYADLTIGHFTALAPAATKYRTIFTAVGRITSRLAVTEFTAPAVQTIQAVANAINQLTGVQVEFESGIDTSKEIEHPITGNCRDALTVLAGVVFGYATETNTGTVKIHRFSCTPTVQCSADHMTALPELAEINFKITGIQAVTETGVYETGNPINVTIDNNYVTEDLFDTFAGNLIGIEYRPGSVPLALGDPRIEPSDTLQISVDDEIYVVPCFSIIHTFDGGFQTEIITPAEQEIGEIVGTMSAEVKEAIKTAREAAEQADDARKVATNYLSRDATGVMVADLNDGNQTPSTATGRNVKIDTDSVDVRDGQTILASFGETSQIGESDKSHASFDYHSLQLTDKNGNVYFYVSDLRDQNGEATITETFTGDGSKQYFGLSFGPDSVESVTINGVETSAYRIGYASASILFETAPSDGDEIEIVYITTSIALKAYTLGIRDAGDVGAMSVALGYNNVASGDYSYAEGYNAVASNNSSHAEGDRTTASGLTSHSEGSRSEASGTSSHAEGFMSTASSPQAHAEGGYTEASGTASHAEGSRTTASGNYSHSEGNYTEASGDNSHAEGMRTTASGTYSHTEGDYTTASDLASHAEGEYTEASGRYSHAEGFHTEASGERSHAEGIYTKASASSSHAEGEGAEASGPASHAEGDGTEASGNYSHAEGYYTEASGNYSHAEGYYTEASGPCSHAEGSNTEASAHASHAQNEGTIADWEYQTALGKYNEPDASSNDHAFFIGNGSNDSNRSNAFAVTWEGDGELALDTTAGAGTTDGDLYALIQTLGWDTGTHNVLTDD